MKRNITMGFIITLLAAGLLFVSCDFNPNIGETGISLGLVDMDGDGTADGTAIDINADGVADGVDTDGDGAIDEAWSDDYKIIEDVSEPDTTPPAEITGLTLNKIIDDYGYGALNFTWTDPADADLSQIIIHYEPTGSTDTDDYTREIPKGSESVTIYQLDKNQLTSLTFETVDTSGNTSSGIDYEFYVPSSTFDSVTYITDSNKSNLNTLLSNNGYYLLDTDIDLSSTSNWIPVNSFSGVLWGNGHVISNITIETSKTSNGAGMFAKLADGGVLRNVALQDASLTVTSSINYIGLLVGQNEGSISYCSANGSVTASNCSYVGGLIGFDSSPVSAVKNSYAAVNVTATGSSFVGGFGGRLYGATDCYATGNVSGNSTVGGFEGQLAGGTSRCYSTGAVSGTTNVSGFVYNVSSAGITATNCYYNSTAAGQSDSYASDIDLTSQSAFSGFDFDSTWSIDSSINGGMPYLTGMP